MYSIFCSALIVLGLENVSGCLPWASQSRESPITKHTDTSYKGTQNFTCVQRYQDGNNQQKIIAGHITTTQTEVKIVYFTIKVEIFDNNTEIYCTVVGNEYPLTENAVTAGIGAIKTVFDLSTKSKFPNKTIIKVTNENPAANEKLAVIKYVETQNVSFSCPEHISKTSYTQLGIINPSSNKIETVPGKTLSQEFKETHNGTILCCIYYVVTGLEERRINRNVSNKTLLIYNDGNYNDDSDNRRQDTLKGSGNRTTTYIITTAAGAAVLILIVVIVIWKKRCRKKPQSNATVLYAELDILRLTAPETTQRPRPRPEEESPYVQIIGVMRAQ